MKDVEKNQNYECHFSPYFLIVSYGVGVGIDVKIVLFLIFMPMI